MAQETVASLVLSRCLETLRLCFCQIVNYVYTTLVPHFYAVQDSTGSCHDTRLPAVPRPLTVYLSALPTPVPGTFGTTERACMFRKHRPRQILGKHVSAVVVCTDPLHLNNVRFLQLASEMVAYIHVPSPAPSALIVVPNP